MEEGRPKKIAIAARADPGIHFVRTRFVFADFLRFPESLFFSHDTKVGGLSKLIIVEYFEQEICAVACT